MAITRADIVTRVAERLQVVGEGCEVNSQDRVTIERAIDDAYNANRDELRLAWDLDDIPPASVASLVMLSSALAATATNAPNAPMHEASYASGMDALRTVNRIRPDNTEVIWTDHF